MGNIHSLKLSKWYHFVQLFHSESSVSIFSRNISSAIISIGVASFHSLKGCLFLSSGYSSKLLTLILQAFILALSGFYQMKSTEIVDNIMEIQYQRVDLLSFVNLRVRDQWASYVGTPVQGYLSIPSHLTTGTFR